MNSKSLLNPNVTGTIHKALPAGTRVSTKPFRIIVLVMVFIISGVYTQAQTETFAPGAYIVNMGITPQTVGNALKPYGMIYQLVTEYGIPIKWIVEPTKGKDGIDFVHNSIEYRGGPFLIEAIYRNTAVNSVIASWGAQGVIGATTTSPLTLLVLRTLTVSTAPKWTLDKQNGSIAANYFVNAGIPPSAHGGASSTFWKNPSDLNNCDDIFVMPHADPTWSTHSNLFFWNLNHKGSIWLACHSGSALELMFNPANREQQTNFLSEKTGIAAGGGPWATPNNSLIIWTAHSNGTPPYSYSDHGDPIMQFMGPIDAAVLNGSEQIYIPVQNANAGWRPTTVVAVYDPDHPQATSSANGTVEKYRAAVIAYGRGFGDPNRGFVMLEAGHRHNPNKGTPTTADIAAQRAFFNFSFIVAQTTAPDPEISVDLSQVYSGTANNLSFTLLGDRDISEFTSILWESSCGGSFAPNNAQNTVFTAPVVATPTSCIITITLTDGCNRIYKASTGFTIQCGIEVSTTLKSPCGGQDNGSITMNITGASGPFNWTWNRTSPSGGPVLGTGTLISGLGAGTYNVTVVSNGGTGCSKNFTVALSASNAITISATPVHVSCPGGSNGAINATVSGGLPPFIYSWADGPTTLNRSGLSAETYNLTVTDANGCQQTAQVVITQPAAISITPTITPVQCVGQNNGQISLAVTGGTGPYSFLWNDGNTSQNRTGLAPATYSVTVTDANNCTQTLGGLVVTQPSAAVSVALDSKQDVLCIGQTTGAINITASDGTPGHTYAWTGPGGFTSTNEDISGLAAGNYQVTVTDTRGCTAVLQVAIVQTAGIVLSTVVSHPTCPPGADPPVNTDGTITVTASGGTAPYNVSWTGPSSGNPAGDEILVSGGSYNILNLQAGIYTVTVLDANGCTASVSVTITEQNPLPTAPSTINNN